MTAYDQRENFVLLDFSFFLPMDERIRAEHIQEAIRECCSIGDDEGTVLVDEFAPTDSKDKLCIKGYVETTQHEGDRIMNSLNAQFARDGVTEHLMSVLGIESPVLRAEKFTCRFSSEGPEHLTDLLDVSAQQIEHPEDQGYEYDHERDENINASSGTQRVKGGDTGNMITRNNDNANNPSFQQHATNDEPQDADILGGHDGVMYLPDDAEFDDPSVPV
ncbi:hypothetical protein RFI_08098 [Reticulomyxa filosa]|uniref:Uncharacterized protein n=1 Tax=Reticulomyxa filosa TaxID=46433 RepID=X6NSV5_RETFI|nr:hypothetical protein RFI_08098 [Reticulomyxa filosa]|eukprot:ETO29028.1 hypothetical protein RFI_08098 [Reticulomyxa filosa]